MIANVCTISDYAPYLPENGSDRVGQVTTARLAEDDAFAAVLLRDIQASGENLSWVDLGWQDAPLRRQIVTEQVLDAEAREDEVLRLAEQLASLAPAEVVLAPMGLGGHIDHLLVRDAAQAAFDPDTLLFYEDLPYACRLASTQTAATPATGFAVPQPDPGQALIDLKRRYVLCYPSQVSPEVADEIELYTQRHHYQEAFSGSGTALNRARSLLGIH